MPAIRMMIKENIFVKYSFFGSYSKLNTTSLPISCKLVNQSVLQTSLENVLSLRLREGYTVKRVQIQKGFSSTCK